MKQINLKDHLKITIPESWEIEIDGITTSLFDPIAGVGALQVSLYSVPKIMTIDLINELDDSLADKYKNVKSKYINNNTAYIDLTETGVWWRYWLIKSIDSIIYVSYNCERSDKGKEDLIVDGIIKSIQQ